MYKHFLCTLAILALFMTIQSDTRSDNDVYNEDEQLETRYYYNEIGTWKIKQRGKDSEDNGKLMTSVSTKAAQTAGTHALYAYAWFQSKYSYPRIQGQWYLRAQLHHDWATDEEPYEDRGRIRGVIGGMSESGSQSDIDYWAEHDPMDTKKDCAEARALDRFLIHTSHLSRSSGNTKTPIKLYDTNIFTGRYPFWVSACFMLGSNQR